MTTYNKKFYTIVKIDGNMTPNQKFTMNRKENPEKEEVSLLEYYKKRWNLDINPN